VHVVLVSDVMPPAIGGIETALDTLLRLLTDIRFTVVARRPPSGRHPRFPPNVGIRYLSAGDLVQSIFSPLLPRNSRLHAPMISHVVHEWQRRKVVGSIDADLAHLHSYSAFRLVAGIWVRHPSYWTHRLLDWFRAFDEYGVPVLLTDHSLFGGGPEQFRSIFNGLLVDRLRFVICVEKSGKRNVDQYALEKGIDVKTGWIPNPIDSEVFAPAPYPENGVLCVGYAGRFEKEGTRDILALASKAPSWIRIRLALAVRPEDRDRASREVGGLPVEVEWNVPNSDMPRFYQTLHVLLDPWSFGAPRTVLEAMSCGRAVMRIHPEPETDPELPLDIVPVLKAVDAARVYRALEQYRDPAVVRRAGRAGRALIERTYAAREVAAAYRRVYQQVSRKGV